MTAYESNVSHILMWGIKMAKEERCSFSCGAERSPQSSWSLMSLLKRHQSPTSMNSSILKLDESLPSEFLNSPHPTHPPGRRRGLSTILEFPCFVVQKWIWQVVLYRLCVMEERYFFPIVTPETFIFCMWVCMLGGCLGSSILLQAGCLIWSLHYFSLMCVCDSI